MSSLETSKGRIVFMGLHEEVLNNFQDASPELPPLTRFLIANSLNYSRACLELGGIFLEGAYHNLQCAMTLLANPSLSIKSNLNEGVCAKK